MQGDIVINIGLASLDSAYRDSGILLRMSQKGFLVGSHAFHDQRGLQLCVCGTPGHKVGTCTCGNQTEIAVAAAGTTNAPFRRGRCYLFSIEGSILNDWRFYLCAMEALSLSAEKTTRACAAHKIAYLCVHGTSGSAESIRSLSTSSFKDLASDAITEQICPCSASSCGSRYVHENQRSCSERTTQCTRSYEEARRGAP